MQTSAKTGEGVEQVSLNICSSSKISQILFMFVIMKTKTSRKWSIPKRIRLFWKVQLLMRKKLEKKDVVLDYYLSIKNLLNRFSHLNLFKPDKK